MRFPWLLVLHLVLISAIGHAEQPQPADQPQPSAALPLLVGGASISITPDKPVALAGQFHTRIGRNVDSPCTATALALESKRGDEVVDQAIMVSCDLVTIRDGILEEVRERAESR